MPQAAPAEPFDAVAGDYDAAFTERPLGRWLRGMVWERLESAFEPGQHLLELGCGTGEDAVRLARRGMTVTATDASHAMLERTKRKAEEAGVSDRVTTRRLDLASMGKDELPDFPRDTYDGAFSNFGPFNCVEDRVAVGELLASLVRPGGKVVVVAMGPVCPWEIAWHIGRLQPRTAFRRFHSGRTAHVGNGGQVRVWYPSHRRLRREFAPYYDTLEVAGIGLLLPPTEMGRLVERAPRLFERLAGLDRRMAGTLPWRWLNDHYLMVLERR